MKSVRALRAAVRLLPLAGCVETDIRIAVSGDGGGPLSLDRIQSAHIQNAGN